MSQKQPLLFSLIVFWLFISEWTYGQSSGQQCKALTEGDTHVYYVNGANAFVDLNTQVRRKPDEPTELEAIGEVLFGAGFKLRNAWVDGNNFTATWFGELTGLLGQNPELVDEVIPQARKAMWRYINAHSSFQYDAADETVWSNPITPTNTLEITTAHVFAAYANAAVVYLQDVELRDYPELHGPGGHLEQYKDSLDKGNRVMLIGYSQGSLYVDAAFKALAIIRPEDMGRVGYVNFGSLSSCLPDVDESDQLVCRPSYLLPNADIDAPEPQKSPYAREYHTPVNDRYVSALRALLPTILPPNTRHRAVHDKRTFFGHSMSGDYLSYLGGDDLREQQDRIYDTIELLDDEICEDICVPLFERDFSTQFGTSTTHEFTIETVEEGNNFYIASSGKGQCREEGIENPFMEGAPPAWRFLVCPTASWEIRRKRNDELVLSGQTSRGTSAPLTPGNYKFIVSMEPEYSSPNWKWGACLSACGPDVEGSDPCDAGSDVKEYRISYSARTGLGGDLSCSNEITIGGHKLGYYTQEGVTQTGIASLPSGRVTWFEGCSCWPRAFAVNPCGEFRENLIIRDESTNEVIYWHQLDAPTQKTIEEPIFLR